EGFSGDGGRPTSARISFPEGIAINSEGDVYWCDIGTHRVRRGSAATGLISTVAGTGEKGISPDGLPAMRSQLWSPGRLAFDRDGSLFIADIGNARVCRVDRATGLLRTVAGCG